MSTTAVPAPSTAPGPVPGRTPHRAARGRLAVVAVVALAMVGVSLGAVPQASAAPAVPVAPAQVGAPGITAHPTQPGCFWDPSRTKWLCEQIAIINFKLPPRPIPGQSWEEFTPQEPLALPPAYDGELPGTRGSYWERAGGVMEFRPDVPLMHVNAWSNWTTSACWFSRSCVGGHVNPLGHRWEGHREDWFYKAKVVVPCGTKCGNPPVKVDLTRTPPITVTETVEPVPPAAASLVAGDIPVGGDLRVSQVSSLSLAAQCQVTITTNGSTTKTVKPCSQVDPAKMYEVVSSQSAQLTLTPGPGVVACRDANTPSGCNYLASAVTQAGGAQAIEVRAYRATGPGQYLTAAVGTTSMVYKPRTTTTVTPGTECSWTELPGGKITDKKCSTSAATESSALGGEKPMAMPASEQRIRLVNPVSSPGS